MPKNKNWDKFQPDVLLIHSAEFNVNIKGIITAQFRTGTWFGRRNTVGMKCSNFQELGHSFFKRETILTFQKNDCHVISGDKYWSSVFSPQAGVPQVKRKRKKASGFHWTHYWPGAAIWTLCSAHPCNDFWLFLCFFVLFCVLGKLLWVTQLQNLVSLHCIVAFKGLISKQSTKLTQNVAPPVTPLQLKIPIVTLGNLPQPVDPERRPVVPLPLSLYKCHLNLLTLHWFDRLTLDYTVQVRFRLNNAGSRFCWLITGAPWGKKNITKVFWSFATVFLC